MPVHPTGSWRKRCGAQRRAPRFRAPGTKGTGRSGVGGGGGGTRRTARCGPGVRSRARVSVARRRVRAAGPFGDAVRVPRRCYRKPGRLHVHQGRIHRLPAACRRTAADRTAPRARRGPRRTASLVPAHQLRSNGATLDAHVGGVGRAGADVACGHDGEIRVGREPGQSAGGLLASHRREHRLRGVLRPEPRCLR